jgi:type I restriction enzyme S subunit
MRTDWQVAPLGKFISQSKKKVKVEDGTEYPAVGVMMEGRGFVTRPPFIGGVTTYKQLTPIEPNQLVLRSITAWEAPIQVTTHAQSGFHVSGVFPVFDIDATSLNPKFLSLLCQYEPFWESMRERTVGSVLRRKTLSAKSLMEIPIQLPPLPEQKRIVDLISSVDSYIESLQQQLESAKRSRGAVLHEMLSEGGEGWVEYSLDDVTECSWGNTETTKSKYVDSGYLAYSASGADGFLEWFEHERTAVVLSAIGAQCGKTWFAEGKWTSIKNTIWLKSDNSNLLDKYLYYLSNRDQFWQIRGQAQPFISLGDVKKTKVTLPPLPEQKRIVDLMSSMDDGISATEKLISETKQLRSGLLSDLLSGEHEIPTSYDKVMGAAR